jgi:hypothetical protein
MNNFFASSITTEQAKEEFKTLGKEFIQLGKSEKNFTECEKHIKQHLQKLELIYEGEVGFLLQLRRFVATHFIVLAIGKGESLQHRIDLFEQRRLLGYDSSDTVLKGLEVINFADHLVENGNIDVAISTLISAKKEFEHIVGCLNETLNTIDFRLSTALAQQF